MSKNTVTPADVAAKAAEEKLVVPSQSEHKDAKTLGHPEDGSDCRTSDCCTNDVPSQSEHKKLDLRLKARAVSLGNLLKEHRKSMLAIGAVTAAVAVSFAQYAKKQAVKNEDNTLTEDEKKSITDAMAAGEIGG